MEYRNKQMNFRVTESEYEVIRKRMELTGIKSSSAYLRKMAMNGYIIQMDLSDLKELVRIEHINSNNINQYARRANETGTIYSKDIEDLKHGQEDRKKVNGKVNDITIYFYRLFSQTLTLGWDYLPPGIKKRNRFPDSS